MAVSSADVRVIVDRVCARPDVLAHFGGLSIPAVCQSRNVPAAPSSAQAT